MTAFRTILYVALTLLLVLAHNGCLLNADEADDEKVFEESNVSSASTSSSVADQTAVPVDPNGYLIYCPCMGKCQHCKR
jgi:hypothetical protein